MLKLFTFIILLTAFGYAHSQSSTLPSAIIDSLIFEVKVGRACGQLVKATEVENNKLMAELVHQEKVIRLKAAEVTYLESVVEANRHTLPPTVKKRRGLWPIVILEAMVIAVLVASFG